MKSDDTDLHQAISQLTTALHRVYPPTRVLIWRSFLQGLFTALGATVGLSLVLALLTFLLHSFQGILPFEIISPRLLPTVPLIPAQ